MFRLRDEAEEGLRYWRAALPDERFEIEELDLYTLVRRGRILDERLMYPTAERAWELADYYTSVGYPPPPP
jgi:hypothetical protein